MVLLAMIRRYVLRRGINGFGVLLILFSVATLFTVNAVFKGFHSELNRLFRGSEADALVEWPYKPPLLSELDDRLEGWTTSPALKGFGMLKTSYAVTAVQTKGVIAEREKILHEKMGLKSVPFEELKVSSSEEDPMGGLLGLLGDGGGGQDTLLLGELLAQRLGVAMGDRVTLVLPEWGGSIAQGEFVVGGVFRTGNYEDDSSRVYLPLKKAMGMQKRPFEILQVHAPSSQKVQELEEDLLRDFPNAQVRTWKSLHLNRLRAVVNERKVVAIVFSMILIVASFGILAIQWSFVREKTRDIGILRAMGFSRTFIFSTFLGVSWVVGLTGLIGGLGVGVLIGSNANEILSFTGWNPFPGDLYYHDGLPVSLEWRDAVWISILSLSVTTIAGLLPAWRALKVDAIDAIVQE
jgi:lipoprotein-releasing system permease protein